MPSSTSRHIVEQFWEAMKTNDFRAAAAWLHEEYVLEWPQSGERVRGRENFIAVNEHYPAAGRWQFDVRRLIAVEQEVVTEVQVTDGVLVACAITFSKVHAGKIVHQTEYWPDPFAAAPWRAPWVEQMG